MSEGFKQTQTERCVVYCVSDIRVIHMAPSAGSLCFPASADFHPCSPRGAGENGSARDTISIGHTAAPDRSCPRSPVLAGDRGWLRWGRCLAAWRLPECRWDMVLSARNTAWPGQSRPGLLCHGLCQLLSSPSTLGEEGQRATGKGQQVPRTLLGASLVSLCFNGHEKPGNNTQA